MTISQLTSFRYADPDIGELVVGDHGVYHKKRAIPPLQGVLLCRQSIYAKRSTCLDDTY